MSRGSVRGEVWGPGEPGPPVLESARRTLMSDWIEPAVNMVFGALALVLLVQYRDKGILRRICESKYRFRSWLKSTAK